MLKKLLAGAIVVVIGGWLALWAVAEVLERRYAARAWPVGLGSLDEVPKRFPRTTQSAAATQLIQLAKNAELEIDPATRAEPPLPAMRKELGEHLRVQLERSGDAIEPLPPAVAAYFAKHDAELNAVRDHLLGGETLAWDSDVVRGFEAPVPDLHGHMILQRVLVTRALEKARQQDPAAWNELRASWELNRALWNRPDLISIMIALASTRMSNGAARKMPLPAPAWLAEQQSFDAVRPMAASQQAEAWSMAHYEIPMIPTLEHIKVLVAAPWYKFSASTGIELMRRHNEEVLRGRACDVTTTQYEKLASTGSYLPDLMVPNLLGAWQRALRYRAEAEGTERVLQLRAGQTPSARSACSDGTWAVTATSVKFTRNIEVEAAGLRVPLEYTR